MQYMYIVGKYIIHLYELYKQVEKPLAIFPVLLYAYCV